MAAGSCGCEACPVRTPRPDERRGGSDPPGRTRRRSQGARRRPEPDPPAGAAADPLRPSRRSEPHRRAPGHHARQRLADRRRHDPAIRCRAQPGRGRRRAAAPPRAPPHRALPDPQPGHRGRFDCSRRSRLGAAGGGVGARRRAHRRRSGRPAHDSRPSSSSSGCGPPPSSRTRCSRPCGTQHGRDDADSPSRSSLGDTAISRWPASPVRCRSATTTASSGPPSRCSGWVQHRSGPTRPKRRSSARPSTASTPGPLRSPQCRTPNRHDDLHGTAAYRRRVATHLTEVALTRAIAEAANA